MTRDALKADIFCSKNCVQGENEVIAIHAQVNFFHWRHGRLDSLIYLEVISSGMVGENQYRLHLRIADLSLFFQGENGVYNMMTLLKEELDIAMALTGKSVLMYGCKCCIVCFNTDKCWVQNTVTWNLNNNFI